MAEPTVLYDGPIVTPRRGAGCWTKALLHWRPLSEWTYRAKAHKQQPLLGVPESARCLIRWGEG
jgi:hypothetical protein